MKNSFKNQVLFRNYVITIKMIFYEEKSRGTEKRERKKK